VTVFTSKMCFEGIIIEHLASWQMRRLWLFGERKRESVCGRERESVCVCGRERERVWC